MKILLSAVAAAVSLFVFAGEKFEFPEKGDWKDSAELKSKEGDVLEFSGKGELHSTERIAVDPAGKIRFSGKFRKNQASERVLLFAAFWVWDKDNRQITPSNVDVVPGTETELSVPAGKTAKSVFVKEGGAWKAGMRMAFGTAPDFSDLPNFRISGGTVVKSEKQADGTWKIEFNAPLYLPDQPVGTRVRAHKNGGGYQYILIQPLTDDFKSYEGIMSGTGNAVGKWWPGAAKAELVLFARTGTISMKDVVVEQLEK